MRRVERWVPFSGVLAVVLWIVGVVVTQSSGVPDEGAPDAEYLAHYESNATTVLTGGWIYMLGWLAFLVFAVVLRERLAEAEGGRRFFTTVAFLGAAAVGTFGLMLAAPEIGAAIQAEEGNISASTAAALFNLGEAFLVAQELAAVLLMLGAGLVALATGLFPKWWTWLTLLFAFVLLIAPIGWVALFFGLPLWTLVTTFLLARGARPAPA